MFLLSLFSLVALIAACTNQPQKKQFQQKEEITLAAAASLESVMEKKIIPAFEKEHPDIQVTGTYDSSGKLQMQIEKGLKADVFFSASTKQMNALVAEKLINKKVSFLYWKTSSFLLCLTKIKQSGMIFLI